MVFQAWSYLCSLWTSNVHLLIPWNVVVDPWIRHLPLLLLYRWFLRCLGNATKTSLVEALFPLLNFIFYYLFGVQSHEPLRLGWWHRIGTSLVSIVWTLQSLDLFISGAWMLSSHLRVLDNILWSLKYLWTLQVDFFLVLMKTSCELFRHHPFFLLCSRVGHLRLSNDV